MWRTCGAATLAPYQGRGIAMAVYEWALPQFREAVGMRGGPP